MRLFIDGDAFPNALKPILFRAIERKELETLVIANKKINIGESPLINYIVVEAGPDEADDKIVEMVQPQDLVITADIPLADRVISKKAFAIDQRGKEFSEANIKQLLAMRDIMQAIRDNGEQTRGPRAFSKKDARDFANNLDRLLTKLMK
jgi:uncharacterized protein YaiI (UPF0178 family)